MKATTANSVAGTIIFESLESIVQLQVCWQIWVAVSSVLPRPGPHGFDTLRSGPLKDLLQPPGNWAQSAIRRADRLLRYAGLRRRASGRFKMAPSGFGPAPGAVKPNGLI